MEPAGCCHPLTSDDSDALPFEHQNLRSISELKPQLPLKIHKSERHFKFFLPQLDSSRVFPHLEMGLDSLGTKLSPKFDPYRFVYRNGLIWIVTYCDNRFEHCICHDMTRIEHDLEKGAN